MCKSIHFKHQIEQIHAVIDVTPNVTDSDLVAQYSETLGGEVLIESTGSDRIDAMRNRQEVTPIYDGVVRDIGDDRNAPNSLR